jgi:hypothetical protein
MAGVDKRVLGRYGCCDGYLFLGSRVAYFAGTLMWLLNHARPSKMPSPVVAQLGSTFQMWFFAMTLRLRASETSFGRMAV